VSGAGKEDPAARLLPWSSPEGKPCYVVGGGTSYVSRRADATEATQLDMADHLLDHTAELLAEPRVTSEELRYVAGRPGIPAGRQAHRGEQRRAAEAGGVERLTLSTRMP